MTEQVYGLGLAESFARLVKKSLLRDILACCCFLLIDLFHSFAKKTYEV